MWRICSSGVGPNSVNYLFKGKLWNESTEFAQLIQSQYTFEHSLIMNSHKQTTSLWFWHRFWIIDTKLRCFANSLNLSCLKSGIFLHKALSILELILRDDSIHPDMNMVYCVWNVNQEANSRNWSFIENISYFSQTAASIFQRMFVYQSKYVHMVFIIFSL